MRTLAFACLLAALVLGGADLRRAGARVRPEPAPRLANRLARRYDRSRAGRRLAARLWRAQVHMSPAGWRAAQLMLTAPVAMMAVALGATPVAGLTCATTITRTGGSLLLRARRGAAAKAIEAAAPQLARALATELAAWGSGCQALAAAARRCEGREAVVAARVFQGAAARVLLGGDAASSLHRAVRDAAPQLPSTSPAAHVDAVFALHRHDAAATAAALERLAASLEHHASARNDARAATSEVRMSAVAVPVIAAATLVMLLATDPAALAAASSMPLLPMLGAAALLVTTTSLGVRRLLTP